MEGELWKINLSWGQATKQAVDRSAYVLSVSKQVAPMYRQTYDCQTYCFVCVSVGLIQTLYVNGLKRDQSPHFGVNQHMDGFS